MRYFLFTVLVIFTLNCFGQNSSGLPSGNIGIGTATPSFPLHIKKSEGFLLKLEGMSGFSGLNMTSANTSKAFGLHYVTDGTSNFSTNSLRFGRYSLSGDAWGTGWEATPIAFDMDAPDGSFVVSQTGKVGIGTFHPEFKFDVTVSDAFDGILLRKNNSGWLRIHPNTLGQSAYNTITKAGDAGIIFGEGVNPGDLNFGFVLAPWDNGLSGLRMDKDGKVGIGTATPQTSLHVAGGQIAATVDDALAGFTQLWSDNALIWKTGNINGGLRLGSATDLAASGWAEKMRILDNGNVGIGIANPQAKLAVNGDIFSKKVKVTQVGWADFVFAPSYKLRPLHEVKLFIQQHSHLPDIPSEKEVVKNGQDLGEMNKLLLQKVEELTLYIIQMREELDELKKNQK